MPASAEYTRVPLCLHCSLTCGSVVAGVEALNVTVSPQVGPLAPTSVTTWRTIVLPPLPGFEWPPVVVLPPPLPAKAVPATRPTTSSATIEPSSSNCHEWVNARRAFDGSRVSPLRSSSQRSPSQYVIYSTSGNP